MSEYAPNYINPPSRVPVVLSINILLALLASIFVGSRVFIRIKLKRAGVDDLLIVIAWVIVLAITICVCVSTRYGLGLHSWDVTPEQILTNRKLSFSFIALYNPSLIFYKSSILTFYLRLAPHPFTTFRTTCYITIVYTLISSSTFFFINIFGCVPISAAWETVVGGRCVDKHILYLISGINNVVTDMLLLLLPIPIVMKLRMKWRIKVGIIAMFSMGFLVTVVSAVRLYSVHVAMTSHDYTWDGAYSSMWSATELNVGVMTACMPAAKQVMSWVWPGSMGTEEEIVMNRVERDIEIAIISGREEYIVDTYPQLQIGAGGGSEECMVKGAFVVNSSN